MLVSMSGNSKGRELSGSRPSFSKDRSEEPIIAPRLLAGIHAAQYCGIGLTLFLRVCPLKPIKLGDRKLWDVRALDAWIDKLSSTQNNGATPNGEGQKRDAAEGAIDRLRNAAQKNKKPRKRTETRSR